MVSDASSGAVALQPTVEASGDASLTFSAMGPPGGLGINPHTRLVAGTVANSDGSGSPYSVIPTATDGTSSHNFTRTVGYIAITDPGTQLNAPSDNVFLQIQASAPPNDNLTYSITGLFPGLEFDTATDLVSGILGDISGSDTPYSVTVYATDEAIRPKAP